MSKPLVQLVANPQLSVEFQLEADRFHHRICLGDPADGQRTLTSIEGTDQDRWPPSPVFQEIDACTLGDGHEGLLGVGAAGISHWSLALQGNRHLSFEVACRVSDHPEFLGSSYRFSEAVEIVDSTVGSVVLRSAAADWRLELLTEGEIQTSHENRQICMGPRLAVESTPATVRWTYRIGPA